MGSRVRNFFSLQFRLFHRSQLLAVQPQGVLDVKNKNPQSTIKCSFPVQTPVLQGWESNWQGYPVGFPDAVGQEGVWTTGLDAFSSRDMALQTLSSLWKMTGSAHAQTHPEFSQPCCSAPQAQCILYSWAPPASNSGWQHPLATFWPQIYKYTIVVMRFKC